MTTKKRKSPTLKQLQYAYTRAEAKATRLWKKMESISARLAKAEDVYAKAALKADDIHYRILDLNRPPKCSKCGRA